MRAKTAGRPAKASSSAAKASRFAGAPREGGKGEKAQLALLKKVLGQAQVAVEELRRVRKVDARSLREPFTV